MFPEMRIRSSATPALGYMNNQAIANIFSEMADLLELTKDNPFRIRAYQRAAQVISGMARDVSEISQKKLLGIKGIGPGLASKIEEFLKTGRIAEYEKCRGKFPDGVLQMMRIPGMGPKRASLVYEKLRITSTEKLKSFANQGKLRELPGFGPKLEESIVKGIELIQEGSQRLLLWEAKMLMTKLLAEMKKAPGVIELCPAGSFRRGKETIGDLDILCTVRGGEAAGRGVIGYFTKHPFVERVLAGGETRASAIIEGGVQCDLRVVPPESFGAALMYFTGSKEHNVALRGHALKLGYTLNEYGLFRVGKESKAVAGRTEEEVFSKLGLQFIPPELRENRGEIESAARKALPDLVEEKDINGDFHNHTNLSDGAHTSEDMVRTAAGFGWKWIFIGDHSQSLKVARGLSPRELLNKIKVNEALNAKFGDLRVMTGIEVDIKNDGSLDYENDILARLGCVVAAVHTGFKQNEDKITDRIITAMQNPYTHIIAHLSGRLLFQREPYAVNIERVLEAAAQTRTALEINGQPERLDLFDVHVKRAKELGVPISLGTDAHAMDQFNYMSLAVTVARRGWLEKKDLLNCLEYKELMAWLKNKRAK